MAQHRSTVVLIQVHIPQCNPGIPMTLAVLVKKYSASARELYQVCMGPQLPSDTNLLSEPLIESSKIFTSIIFNVKPSIDNKIKQRQCTVIPVQQLIPPSSLLVNTVFMHFIRQLCVFTHLITNPSTEMVAFIIWCICIALPKPALNPPLHSKNIMVTFKTSSYLFGYTLLNIS